MDKLKFHERLPQEDSQGNPIAGSANELAAFWRWFGRSIVVDCLGRPRVAYRGEHGKSNCRMQFQSRRGSLSFGSAEAAKFYASTPHDCAVDAAANTPRIFSAYLKIERPVIASLTDPFIELGQLGAMIGEGFLNELAVDFSEDITYTSQWIERFSEYRSPAHLAKCDAQSFKSLYFAYYAILDSQKWIERLKLSGFDGAIHCGSGVTACEAEYKVFSPDQAWIIARQRIDAR